MSKSYATAEIALEAALQARSKGDLDQAIAAAEAATRLDPSSHRAWVVLAGSATRASRDSLAEEAQRRALETTSDPLQQARIKADRAFTLTTLGRWGEALELAREAAPSLMDDPKSRAILAVAMNAAGAVEEAEPHLEAAVSALPQRSDYWYNLGAVRRTLGKIDEAAAAWREAVRLAPGFLPAHTELAHLEPATSERNHVEHLRRIRSRLAPGEAAAQVDYALFKQLDELNRKDEAWVALERATAAMAASRTWDRELERQVVAAIGARRGFTELEQEQRAGPRPIFIVGLPRTGTSLVERMLAQHPEVTPLGELEAFPRVLKEASGLPLRPFVSAAALSAEPDWRTVGSRYRDEIRVLAGQDAAVVTDKLPLNLWYSGSIAAALPDAVIVHVRRDPMDALFGAYKLSFSPVFDWSYRFSDMVAHYRAYREVAQHWRDTLGARFVEVGYEDLVRDPEQEMRRLLEACGLPFDEAVLKTAGDGAVRTPSNLQVRQPVSDRFVGAWRRYADQLEPLRAQLEEAGFVDAAGNGL